MWKKIFRTKKGDITEHCANRIADESETAAAFLLINRQRRVQMFLNYKTFIVAANGYTTFTHYFIVPYPVEE